MIGRSLLVALGLAGYLTACTSEPEPPISEQLGLPAGSAVAEIADSGTIRIGTALDRPPFAERATDGALTGFDVEIAAIIAGELGIQRTEIDWVETGPTERETALEEGVVDLVVSAYPITDERKLVVDFAGPYIATGPTLLTAAGGTAAKDPADLSGSTVCVARDSPAADQVHSRYPGAVLVQVDATGDCLDPLRAHEIDILAADAATLLEVVAAAPGEFDLTGDLRVPQPYGIGVAKGDDTLRAFINDALAAAFGDGRWAAAWESTIGAVLPVPAQPPTLDRY